jgi:hypothetical protein
VVGTSYVGEMPLSLSGTNVPTTLDARLRVDQRPIVEERNVLQDALRLNESRTHPSMKSIIQVVSTMFIFGDTSADDFVLCAGEPESD